MNTGSHTESNTESTAVWFNCCAGVAGDMLLASLIDAGADQLDVMDAWSALGIDGYAATWERVQRCGVAAMWTNIVIHEHAITMTTMITTTTTTTTTRTRTTTGQRVTC